ncbi:hypothetical protein FN976_18640 [Caenimonas sedimenti]|uniref:Uncharacterized protein n=1 Tax=Caenimonas sedimenti TaxID=2596921 RepID=A0A562ZNV6_9BURK|nr:hypothetical protein [Caenimonas sedimenti]TWO69834.1 hypothetical protein FN976_18640 [Caenimonas sedimenti]
MAAAEGTRCEFEPVIKAAGSEDGTSRIPADLTGRTAAGVPPLLVTGKESAAAGRQRDAEVAFLTACRIGRELGPPGSGVYADAKYQLGRHYAMVARTTESDASRPELLRRARVLYTDALQALRAQHGESHEKTRFAAQGLAALPPAGADDEAPKTAKADPAPKPAADPAPKPEPAVAEAPKPAKAPAAVAVAPPASAEPAPAPAPVIVRAPPEAPPAALPAPPVAKAPPRPRSEARAPAEPRVPVPPPELASAPQRRDVEARPRDVEARPRDVEARVVEAPPIQSRAPEPRVAVERPAPPRPRAEPPQEPAVVIEEPPGAATGSTGTIQ